MTINELKEQGTGEAVRLIPPVTEEDELASPLRLT